MVWFLFAPLSVLVWLSSFVMAFPIVALTSPEGKTPAWAWPWLTPDNPIDGDLGHLARWVGRPVWMRRVAWLWRNGGDGFATRVCGHWVWGSTAFKGDRATSDSPYHAGWCWATNHGAWEIYAVSLKLFGFFIRLRLGWKIPLTVDAPTENCQMVTHISIRWQGQ